MLSRYCIITELGRFRLIRNNRDIFSPSKHTILVTRQREKIRTILATLLENMNHLKSKNVAHFELYF